jgi:hypothetical protein
MLDCGHQCPTVCGENCPSSKFCQQCCSQTRKDCIVDIVMQSTYEDHDVDADPVVILSCQHICAISTLDAHLDMKAVYDVIEPDVGEIQPLYCFGLKSLKGNNEINGKPKTCPHCRKVITTIYRYGRVLRLNDIRILERKHNSMIQQRLNEIQTNVIDDVSRTTSTTTTTTAAGIVARLLNIKALICKSPMRTVYEASRGEGFESDNAPPTAPPVQPMLQCLELMAFTLERIAKNKNNNKEDYERVVAVYEEAIELADSSTSTYRAARFRLRLGKLMITTETMRNEIKELNLLQWLEIHGTIYSDLHYEINQYREFLSKPNVEAVKLIIAAMAGIRPGEYAYGGSPSSHWYECPNGHPYFIGECGGAMEVAVCNECNAPIGGTGHSLLSTNQSVRGIVRQALGS